MKERACAIVQYHITLGPIQPLTGYCHGSERAWEAGQRHRGAGFHQMKQHLHQYIADLQNVQGVMQ